MLAHRVPGSARDGDAEGMPSTKELADGCVRLYNGQRGGVRRGVAQIRAMAYGDTPKPIWDG